MLTIQVPMSEAYDESTETFVTVQSCTLELEHSLASLSKWESEFEKPFLGPVKKTPEETLAYIRCMVRSPDFSPEVLTRLSRQNIEAINEYINAKFTATTINERSGKPNREIITAEIIYYWLVALQIPLEVEHWHLNKMLTLVKVVNLKQAPEKPMSKAEALAMQRRLNSERRQQMQSRG